jgi:hypothetical protein
MVRPGRRQWYSSEKAFFPTLVFDPRSRPMAGRSRTSTASLTGRVEEIAYHVALGTDSVQTHDGSALLDRRLGASGEPRGFAVVCHHAFLPQTWSVSCRRAESTMEPVTRVHARPLPGTSMKPPPSSAGPKSPAKQTEWPKRPDPFTNRERVRRCIRFVPDTGTCRCLHRRKTLQMTRKPTPGLEPGTPSLRVSGRCHNQSP